MVLWALPMNAVELFDSGFELSPLVSGSRIFNHNNGIVIVYNYMVWVLVWIDVMMLWRATSNCWHPRLRKKPGGEVVGFVLKVKRVEPLKERVVDSELDIRVSGVQSRLEFTQNIPLGSDVNRIPAESEAGRPVCEALMVLAREHQIPVEQEVLALACCKLSIYHKG